MSDLRSDLRQSVMAECLDVSRLACAIFDATEADAITPATAWDVVAMKESVHAIHAALLAMVIGRWDTLVSE